MNRSDIADIIALIREDIPTAGRTTDTDVPFATIADATATVLELDWTTEDAEILTYAQRIDAILHPSDD